MRLLTPCAHFSFFTFSFSLYMYSYPIQKTIIGDDIDLAYVQLGEGDQTLVFIHGFASHIPVWEHNLNILRKYYRCLALDLPGHGLSAKGDFSYSLDFYGQIVKQWLDKLGIQKAVLVGHSMGGQISIRLALQYPDLFSRLVLVAPAGFETFTATEKTLLAQFASGNILASSQYLKWVLNLKNYFYNLNEKELAKLNELNRDFFSVTENQYLPQILAGSIQGMMNAPVFDQLSNLALPTLIFFGKNDQLIPNKLLHATQTTERIAQQGTSQIPQSKLILYNQCGHFLQYEQPSRFNIDVYKFLNPHIFGH
ncbi:MAG TPA: alpha/beta hydrolase [Microscillaceae bacterium]|nr:alpha/beta hydrolase [Microscillaceae bacterium]